ncbi:MAG: glutaminyl-peptide cyclotransferase [Gemmatimonadetes bacterium]|nr:glutaminyl-peptide cyclotransferase [Gemmatimonadota bacterium]NNM04588.1 glutaminyl-peptide cyclotransferase [Gemmatimonadota bacterium]
MKKPGVLLAMVLLVTTSCDQSVVSLEYEVGRSLPHDEEAYTQGLLFYNGFLYESTGQYGSSGVRKVDLESGEVLQSVDLDFELFGEGLALAGSELYQLTWKSGLAFVYDVTSLSLLRTVEYEGEGWGLCYDGESFFMSNGSNRLLRRSRDTFEVLDEVSVTKNGFSVSALNELECVGAYIYANVFQTDRVVRIDKATGHVVGELDGFRLSMGARRAPNPEAVMNGIAFDPGRDVFFLTGKLWPVLYEVRLN